MSGEIESTSNDLVELPEIPTIVTEIGHELVSFQSERIIDEEVLRSEPYFSNHLTPSKKKK